jgi:presenilin-like A22 family membrane protease
MKHSLKLTLILLGWAAACGCFGLAIIPFMQSKVGVIPALNPWAIAGAMVAAMVGSGFLWYFFLRNVKKYLLFDVAVIYGLAITSVLHRIGLASGDLTMDTGIELAGVFFAVTTTYYLSIKNMQKGWATTRKWMWVSNLFTIVFIASVAALTGAILPPLAAILILVGMAVYDAWAVWGKKQMMVGLATGFIKQRIIPGIALAKEKEEEFAMLGNGDLFFMVLIPAAFFKSSMPMMYASMIGLFAAIIFLFTFSAKKKFYPALPFMLAGCVIGLAVGWYWFI